MMRREQETSGPAQREVEIHAEGTSLPGTLIVPDGATGAVAFVHGSGSSRRSPRNRQVAAWLNEAGLATLLFDLLTPDEAEDRRNVFDVALLAGRLSAATGWLRHEAGLDPDMPLGYFGASTGAAAALWAAAERADEIAAVVSRGGRPDLGGPRLPAVQAPTLLIVGGRDVEVLAFNRQAMASMTAVVELVVVPGATHLFDEPGTLEEAGRHATRWFQRWLLRGLASTR